MSDVHARNVLAMQQSLRHTEERLQEQYKIVLENRAAITQLKQELQKLRSEIIQISLSGRGSGPTS